MEGKNLKAFVQGAAIAEARRVLVERSILTMDPDERDAFLSLLDADPAPTPAARAAAERWREWNRTGVVKTPEDSLEPGEPRF